MKYILPKSMKWRDNPENSRLEALTFIHGVPQYVPINNAFYEQKGSEIMRLLTSGQYGGRADADDGDDLVDLRHQAITHGGLLNAELRRHAWPAMLNVDPQQLSKTETQDVESWKKHRDYDQVMKDVLRASVYFPPGLRNQVKRKLQRQLEEVIMRVLMKHPDLYYYQGFDHICLTFLLVVEKDLAVALAEKTAQRYLRLFMGESLQDTKQLLNCLTLLLHKANPQLLRYLQGGRFESAHCISWLLTWFSYVLDDAAVVCRFFDFFLACHPLMTIYVSAAAIVQREKELLDTQQDEGEMFMAVSKVPDNLCLESVLSLIGDLYVQCPPSLLLTEALQGPPPTSSVAVTPQHQEAVKELSGTTSQAESATCQQAVPSLQLKHKKPLPPAKHEKPLPPAKHEKPLSPAKHEKPLSPAKHEKPLSPAKHEKPLSPAKHEKPLPPDLPSPMTALQTVTLAGCPRPWVPLTFTGWRQAVTSINSTQRQSCSGALLDTGAARGVWQLPESPRQSGRAQSSVFCAETPVSETEGVELQ